MKETMKNTMNKIITAIAGIVLFLTFITKLPVIKNYIDNKGSNTNTSDNKVVPQIDYCLDDEIIKAMSLAHKAAYNYSSAELEKWVEELMARVDNEFLDDYFSFMQAKRRDLLAIYNNVVHFFNGKKDTAEQAAIRELEEEISRKVVKPELSQKKIENITRNAIDVYMVTFDNELIKLQKTYNIPTPEWNKYISSVCGLTLDAKQNAYPIAFKTAVVSGATLTGTVAIPTVKNVATKISSKIAEKKVAKAGTTAAGKLAAKEGTKIASKGAGKVAQAIPYVGWGITAAICIWDLVDYTKTAAEGKKLLRSSLNEYFNEVRIELLSNSENCIMGSITDWENKLKLNIVEYRKQN